MTTRSTVTAAPRSAGSVPAPLPVPELDVPEGGSALLPGPPADGPTRPVALVRTAGMLLGVLVLSLLVGRVVGTRGEAVVHDRMLPWILGRGLGVAAYLALTGTVVLGLWLRHPWRARCPRPTAMGILWGHVALAAATVTLVAGHVAALALDRYAGVGWAGALVPWGAHLRATPVAFGTLALYGLLLVVVTAALAGSIGRAVWFPVHSAAVAVFAVSLVHGVTAGSDGTSLRWLYVATGLVVGTLQISRWAIGTLARRQGLAGR